MNDELNFGNESLSYAKIETKEEKRRESEVRCGSVHKPGGSLPCTTSTTMTV